MARPSSPSPRRRLHYIPEWADLRQKSQADITRALEVNKSTVHHWFAGGMISETHAGLLADFLEAGEPAALFRHPSDDWIARHMKDRSDEERERIIDTLKAAFPRRVA